MTIGMIIRKSFLKRSGLCRNSTPWVCHWEGDAVIGVGRNQAIVTASLASWSGNDDPIAQQRQRALRPL